ncbi:MAG: restriction endonuclease subunit S [Spirochaetota bacterium]|nr:restriction endonuclease subunit S [Spirochaetota bacterium]
MNSSDSVNIEKTLSSAIDKALHQANNLLHMIKDYKKIKIKQILDLEYNHYSIDANGVVSISSRWPIVRLHEFISDDLGIVQGAEDILIYERYIQHEGFPLTESRFLTSLRYNPENCWHVREDIQNEFPHYVVHGSDILMVQAGSFAGASAILPIFHEDVILGNGCIRIRVKAEICEVFYLLNVLHYYYSQGIIQISHKGARDKITIESLLNIQLPNPPMEEQKRIADTLLKLSGAMVAQTTYSDEMLNLKGMI